jgi:hypothetical protein
MGIIGMQMTGSNGIFSVPSEHLPGLIALVLLMPVLWIGLSGLRALATRPSARAEQFLEKLDRLSVTAKVALVASLVGAVVHAAIVPTHWGPERGTAILFIIDAIAFFVVSYWILEESRYWKLTSSLIGGGTAVFYAFYILRGWETMDLVGLLTTTIELAGALVVLSPMAAQLQTPRREGWLMVAALPVAMISLIGTADIASTMNAASASSVVSGSTQHPSTSSMAGMSGMAGMAGMSPKATTAAATKALSLPTTSPAGPIAWPDNMATMAAGMKMAEPNCTTQPTAAQQRAAVSLVDQTVAAAAPYTSLAAAKAAGYVPVTPSGQKIVHYINWSIYQQGHLLDPTSIPVLVYVNTAHGAVLSAAMYLMPAGGTTPPQPGGCLTQWHIHTDLCFANSAVVGTNNAGSCAAGSAHQITPPMMHVWMTPLAGGPLAPDPPDRTEVLSARQLPELAQLNGTA